MHFTDLELCEYHPGALDASSWAVPLRAVGWLEHPHPYATGAPPEGLATRLETLIEQTRVRFSQLTFRGVHRCGICELHGQSFGSVGWSQENLIVPGAGEVFAAPGGVVHYVTSHDYLPPAAFVTAAMNCPSVGSPAYFEALRVANSGTAPPLESSEEFSRRLASLRKGHW
jgi:hypothetical protein